jgi:molybdopterin synthase catalytic subunit
MKDEALERKLQAIDLKHYPEWYRQKLEDAIRFLGKRWPLHPANTRHFTSKRAA